METKQKDILKRIDLRTYSMVIMLVLVAILFGILTKGTFFTPRNLSNLFRTMSITGVICIGMVMIMVSGNIDLAVGAIVALCGGIAAVMQVWHGVATWKVIVVAIALGAALGTWSGYWVAYRGLPAFIVTLGSQLAIRGLYLVITQGITITPIQADFAAISQSYIGPTAGVILGCVGAGVVVWTMLSQRASKKQYGYKMESMPLFILKMAGIIALIAVFVFQLNRFKGIPTPVLILIVLAAIFVFISSRTRFGRRVYAIGGNKEAARLSGINVSSYIITLYVIMGALCGVAGIMLTSRLDGATAAAGTAYETDVISATVIGGTSMAGGKGTILGALIGALIIAALDNGMSLLNVTYYYQNIVKGMVLIFAVFFDVLTQQKRS